MVLDRCPAHHDASQGHHLMSEGKIIPEHAWEIKIWPSITEKAPLSVVVDLFFRGGSVSYFRLWEMWLVVVKSTDFILHHSRYRTKITIVDFSKSSILVPLERHCRPPCEIKKYEIPSILRLVSYVPFYRMSTNIARVSIVQDGCWPTSARDENFTRTWSNWLAPQVCKFAKWSTCCIWCNMPITMRWPDNISCCPSIHFNEDWPIKNNWFEPWPCASCLPFGFPTLWMPPWMPWYCRRRPPLLHNNNRKEQRSAQLNVVGWRRSRLDWTRRAIWIGDGQWHRPTSAAVVAEEGRARTKASNSTSTSTSSTSDTITKRKKQRPKRKPIFWNACLETNQRMHL
jgi:hypothetical protein